MAVTLRILLLLVGFFACATQASAQLDPSSAEYTACAALVKTNPEAALARANTWLEQSKALSARHCKAMALYSLARYKDAAFELETLADGVTDQQPQLWLSIISQAGKARLAAKDVQKAYINLTQARTIVNEYAQDPVMQPIIVETLVDRSVLSLYLNKPYDAIQDLDNALNINPSSVNALIQRGKALDQVGKPAMALIDVRQALVVDPTNLEANTLRRQLEKKVASR